MSKYTHLELNKDVESISGYYTPQKEVRLKYNKREVLYVLGQAVIDSSCCGAANFVYILVPGYIISWQNDRNENGLPISEVEPIMDKTSQDDIRKIIQEAENIDHVEFW